MYMQVDDKAMDWLDQMNGLSSGPIWQFFVRICQKVTTDNHVRHQQTTVTSTAAKSHQCTHRWVVEDMDCLAQIIWLSSGPIWQFLVRHVRKKQQSTTRYVSPTDNWHIHCSKSTSVYTQVDGRGLDWTAQVILAVL